MTKRRFRNAIKTADSFCCPSYKGLMIDINRDEENELDGGEFDIHVFNPEISFGTVYQGHWGDPGATINEAIEEALKGSRL